MLVKLARYLRCLGYDASCDPGISLATRIERADREERTFVTRSTRVEHQQRPPREMLLLRSDDPVVQLREVIGALGLDLQEGVFSRCIRCNVPLEAADKNAAIAARVPERVFAAYEHFWRCPSCDTVFWKGSHVRNTCRKLEITDASDSSGS